MVMCYLRGRCGVFRVYEGEVGRRCGIEFSLGRGKCYGGGGRRVGVLWGILI